MEGRREVEYVNVAKCNRWAGGWRAEREVEWVNVAKCNRWVRGGKGRGWRMQGMEGDSSG